MITKVSLSNNAANMNSSTRASQQQAEKSPFKAQKSNKPAFGSGMADFVMYVVPSVLGGSLAWGFRHEIMQGVQKTSTAIARGAKGLAAEAVAVTRQKPLKLPKIDALDLRQ